MLLRSYVLLVALAAAAEAKPFSVDVEHQLDGAGFKRAGRISGDLSLGVRLLMVASHALSLQQPLSKSSQELLVRPGPCFKQYVSQSAVGQLSAWWH